MQAPGVNINVVRRRVGGGERQRRGFEELRVFAADRPDVSVSAAAINVGEAGETAEGLAGVARDQVRSAGQRINVSIVIRAVGAFHENSEIAAQRNGGAAIDAIGLRVVAVVGIYVRDVGADRSARLSEGSAGDHGETRQEGGGHDIIFHVLVLSIGAGGLLAALIYQPPDRFTVTAESHRCQPLSLSVGSDFACRAQTKRAAPKDRPYRRSSVSAASGGCLHRIS